MPELTTKPVDTHVRHNPFGQFLLLANLCESYVWTVTPDWHGGREISSALEPKRAEYFAHISELIGNYSAVTANVIFEDADHAPVEPYSLCGVSHKSAALAANMFVAVLQADLEELEDDYSEEKLSRYVRRESRERVVYETDAVRRTIEALAPYVYGLALNKVRTSFRSSPWVSRQRDKWVEQWTHFLFPKLEATIFELATRLTWRAYAADSDVPTQQVAAVRGLADDQTAACPVKLTADGQVIQVRGDNATEFYGTDFHILKELVERWPLGLTKSELELKGFSEPHKRLRDIALKHALFESVIFFPGKRGRGGYRIKEIHNPH